MKKILGNLIFIIICLCMILNIFSANDKSFLGIRIFKIGSGSMEPYLKVNDLIIIKEENNYEINDVITFKEGNYYTTHRIVKIEGEKITTKGDANNTEDESITKEEIIGKVIFRIKRIQFISYLIIQPFSWILIFIFGVIFIIIKLKKKSKGKHSKE